MVPTRSLSPWSSSRTGRFAPLVNCSRGAPLAISRVPVIGLSCWPVGPNFPFTVRGLLPSLTESMMSVRLGLSRTAGNRAAPSHLPTSTDEYCACAPMAELIPSRIVAVSTAAPTYRMASPPTRRCSVYSTESFGTPGGRARGRMRRARGRASRPRVGRHREFLVGPPQRTSAELLHRRLGLAQPEMHVQLAEEPGGILEMAAARLTFACPREGPAERQVTATEKRPEAHLLRDPDGFLEGRPGRAERRFA